MMTVSNLGLDLIRGHESLRLKAYLCPAGIWTIGWGHTGGVRPGDTCTREEADSMLAVDAGFAERAVRSLVKVPLTQNQFDALVSLVFNIGTGNFSVSTLLQLLNSSDYQGAANQFHRWNKGRQGGKLVVLNGLVARREDERELFLAQSHAA